MFIDSRDAEIARVLWNFFAAVAARWPGAWAERRAGIMLNRTNGFGGLMRFLGDAYNSFNRPDQVIPQPDFAEIFRRIKLRESDFTIDTYKPGTSGEVQLAKDLRAQAGLEVTD